MELIRTSPSLSVYSQEAISWLCRYNGALGGHIWTQFKESLTHWLCSVENESGDRPATSLWTHVMDSENILT